MNGILRVGGGLEKASILYDTCHPIILPCVSHLTDLIIAHYHLLAGHGGVSMTLNLIMQKFWILKGSAAVRRVIKDCMLCRKVNVKPKNQLMANLPDSRLEMDSHPFAFTGLDYFGLILMRQKCSQVKRYGCIFTCLNHESCPLGISS